MFRADNENVEFQISYRVNSNYIVRDHLINGT